MRRGRAVGAALRDEHAADPIFDDLSRRILYGEWPPGTPLAPERALAESFGVSRAIVREAVHRLAEMRLVRVRQGAGSVVQDPAEAADLRVIELLARLGPASARDVRELGEWQLLQGHAVLLLAQARATDEERAAIDALCASFAADGGAGALLPFEERFWSLVSEAARNRLYRLEIRWWYRRLFEQPRNRHPLHASPELRLSFYRELARRLVAREDAAAHYLEIAGLALAQLSAAAMGGDTPESLAAARRIKRRPPRRRSSP